MLIQVSNVTAKIITATAEEKKLLYDTLAYKVPEAERVKEAKIQEYMWKIYEAKTQREVERYKRKKEWWEQWDGMIHLYDKYTDTFPSGLMYLVSILFEEFTLKEEYDKPTSLTIFEEKEPIILRDYQERIINEVLLNDGRCIVNVSTGGGKTQMGLYLAKHFSVPTLIIVPNVTIEKQWIERIKKYFKTNLDTEKKKKSHRIRVIKNQKNELLFIIATRNFVHNIFYGKSKDKNKRNEYEEYRKMINKVGMVIVDEAHHASSKQFQEILSLITCYYRIGLTGTSDMRSDGTDIVYHAFLGPNVGNLTQQELIEIDHAVRPKIKFINVPEMYFIRPNYRDVYRKYIVENYIRNQIIAKEVVKLASEKRKVLVLTDRIEHNEKLLRYIDEMIDERDYKFHAISTSSKDTKKNEKFNEFLYNNPTQIMICTYQLVGEGFDFPAMSAMVLAGSWKSKTRAIQSLGRLIRKAHTKEDAIFIDFANNCKYLWEHTIERAKTWMKNGFEVEVEGTFLENILETKEEKDILKELEDELE